MFESSRSAFKTDENAGVDCDFPSVTRTVTFSPDEDGGDIGMAEISIVINNTCIDDSDRTDLQSVESPGEHSQMILWSGSSSHMSPPEGRLDSDDTTWAMMGIYRGASSSSDHDIPTLMEASMVSTPDTTPVGPDRVGRPRAAPTASHHVEQDAFQQAVQDDEEYETMLVVDQSTSNASFFRKNETDLALDEQAVYLDRIHDLELQLKDAREHIEKSRQDQIVSLALEDGGSQLLQIKQQRPSPTIEDLLKRNHTLVEEIRFADQTCVQLSSDNKSLSCQISMLKEQLAKEKETNAHLMEEASRASQLSVFMSKQQSFNVDGEQSVLVQDLKREKTRDSETIGYLRRELEDIRNQLGLASLAEASLNGTHVQLVRAAGLELVQVTEERDRLANILALKESELTYITRDNNKLRDSLQSVTVQMQSLHVEYKEACRRIAGATFGWVQEKAEAMDCDFGKLSNRLLCLTESVAFVRESISFEEDTNISQLSQFDDPHRAAEQSHQSMTFFTPTNAAQPSTGHESDKLSEGAKVTTRRDLEASGALLETNLISLGPFQTPETAPAASDKGGESRSGTKQLHFTPLSQEQQTKLEKDNHQLNEALMQYDQRVNELTCELDTVNASLDSTTKERDSLQQRLLVLEKENVQLQLHRDNSDNLQKQLIEANDTFLALRARIKALDEALHVRDAQLHDTKHELDDLQDQMNTLHPALIKAEEFVESLETEVAQQRKLAESSNDELMESLQHLEADRCVKDRDRDILTNQSDSKTEQALDEVELVRVEKEELQDTCNRLEERHHQMKEKISAVEKTLRQREEEVESYLLQLKLIDSQVKTSLKGVDANNVKEVTLADRIETAIRSLSEGLATCSTDLVRVTEELEESNDKLAAKDMEARSLTDKSVLLQTKIEKLRDYVRKVTRKCEEWQQYSGKQAAVIHKTRALYARAKTHMLEVLRTCEEREQIHSYERAVWIAERAQLTSQFEDISKVLLDISVPDAAPTANCQAY